jgi:hypothetical protein
MNARFRIGAVALLLACGHGPTQSSSTSPLSTIRPSPQSTDHFILDTRSGGSKSIQGATTLGQAESASGLSVSENCQSGNCLGPGFTTNVSGAGEHAIVWNIIQNAGDTACIQGGPAEQDWKIYLTTSGVNATGEIDLQYKYWSGQTATGGGAAGNVGVFSHTGGAGGHKDVVWYRQRGGSVTNDGRFTMADEDSTAHTGQKVLWDPVPGEGGTGSGGDIYASDVGALFDKNNHNNAIVTVTYRLRPESAVGRGDGAFQQWMDTTIVLNLQSRHTGTLGWGEIQIGGPTWICPPQDQTMYIWDIVIWQPS